MYTCGFWLQLHRTYIPIAKSKDSVNKAVTYDDFRGIAISPILSKVFTRVSYAEARNSYRLDVRPSVCPSVTRWYCIKTAEHIVMLSSPHDSPFILVLCVLKIFAKFRRGHPLRGRLTEVDMIKPAIFQKHGASINRSIQRAINLVRRSTAINTLATTVRVSTVNSHFQSNEH